MRAFDFKKEMASMMAACELSPVLDGADGGTIGPRLPREIKRAHVTMTQVVGSGAFGTKILSHRQFKYI